MHRRLHYLVRFRAKAGHEGAFAKQMQSVVPATEAEPGNRQFEFYADQDDPVELHALRGVRRRGEHVAVASRASRDGRQHGGHQADSRGRARREGWSQALTNAKPGRGQRSEVGHGMLVVSA